MLNTESSIHTQNPSTQVHTETFRLKALGHAERVIHSLIQSAVQIRPQKRFVPGGVNGPHFAIESPIRNTCHLITLICAARGQGFCLDHETEVVLRDLVHWLIDDNEYFRSGIYIARQFRNYDFCNGVIGPAWIMEALNRILALNNDDRVQKRLEEVIKPLTFNMRVGLWNRYDPFTKRHNIDYTLDHQAWLAASMAECGKIDQARRFLDICANGAFFTRRSGLVNHGCVTPTLGSIVRRSFFRAKDLLHPQRVEVIEAGYQVYVLHPFARLHRIIPEHLFFSSPQFLRALSCLTAEFFEKITDNKYAYSYNAPGFELPLIQKEFQGAVPLSIEEVSDVFDKQLAVTFDPDSGLHCRNCPDPLTLSLRVYELLLTWEKK